MEKEPTNRELLSAIQQVRTDVREETSGAVRGVRDELLGVIQSTQVEILEAMQQFASDVDERFDGVETHLDRVEHRVDRIETNLGRVETRLTGVESSMVTKAYLDDKFADEGSRYGQLIRETNEKTHQLADALVAEGSLNSRSANEVVRSNPFGRK